MNTSSPGNHRRSFIMMAAGTGVGMMLAGRGVTAQQTGTPGGSPEASPEALNGETRVRFAVGDTEIVVLIEENPTSSDFLTMLPLELTFEEFAGREKISYLPRELDTEGSPGHAPANGDLIYYVPWGNLGFFYNAEGGDTPDDSVILIGTIETGFERLDELETGPVHADIIPEEATPNATHAPDM